jgi:tRNA 2-thiocytidine biosynthesis protein TtcA
MTDVSPALDVPNDIHPLFNAAPKTTEFKKLRKRIIRQTREAIDQYGMLDPREPKQKWLVCLSGGKDSYTLLAALYELQWRGLLPVDLLACNLDQGQPNFPATVLPKFLQEMQVPHRIEYKDTYSIVMDKIPQGRTFCSLCSRLRRGNLYRIAREEGCSAIILGHHRDDILETFLMNLFHGGRLSAMPPKLLNEDGDLFVYRPLAHVAEADCEAFAKALNYPIIPCDLCGSQDGLQRQQIKQMLDTWED